MLSPRLSRTDAGITFFVGLGVFAVAASFFIGATRRLAERFGMLSHAHAAAAAVVVHRNRRLAAVRRLLLLRRLDRVHLTTRRHRRPLPRRPQCDDDRDAHRIRPSRYVSLLVPRLEARY